MEPEVTFEAAPAVLFTDRLINSGQAMEFLRSQYRHCKTILALKGSSAVLEAAGSPALLPDGTVDQGLLIVTGQDRETIAEAFICAIARQRHSERQIDLPLG